jgi:hypothetical protein
MGERRTPDLSTVINGHMDYVSAQVGGMNQVREEGVDPVERSRYLRC